MPEMPHSPGGHSIFDSPTYGSAPFTDFQSPPRKGPLGFSQVASLDELYHSPADSFNLNRNLVKLTKGTTLLDCSPFFFNSGPKKIVVI